MNTEIDKDDSLGLKVVVDGCWVSRRTPWITKIATQGFLN